MPIKPIPINVERMKELLRCSDGELFWKVNLRGVAKKGMVAGFIGRDGYPMVKVDQRIFRKSRVIYSIHKHDPGDFLIDHIDHNPKNNRIENLRIVTNQENGRNQGIRSNNTSGVTGVLWVKRRNKWEARIKVDGVKIHLGYFESKEEAIKTRKTAEVKYKFHPNHGRKMERQ